ncbi:MAG: type II toxin-antitoxin system VapB family antitoxin [Gallionella sp.]|nr:type II toxin-antitoxin system VapB family antitoxin [Gallionella sp.]
MIAASSNVIIRAWLTEIMIMRTTLALDDDLIEKAQALTGPMEKTALVREALKALIQRESAKRLALLGGSEPLLEYVPRRQSEPA